MAAEPDSFGPGDDSSFELPPQQDGPDAVYLNNVAAAYNEGYSYDDLSVHHEALGMDAPPRPSLEDIATGGQVSATMLQPEQDKSLDSSAYKLDTEGMRKDIQSAVESGAFMSGETAAVGGLVNWLHGADTALTTDMMQAGRSLWLTQNPGVAKNVGKIVHDVELKPGASLDITEQLAGKAPLEQQRTMYDLMQKYQFDNPDNLKYLDAVIEGTGPVRGVLNQRASVYNIVRRK